MKFWKLHGIGNDFVAIDGRFDNKDASDYSDYAKNVCHRRFSVGADGLLVVKNSDICDVEMVYYNSDGSRGEMCGNGARCICRFAYEHGVVGENMTVETDAGIVEGTRIDEAQHRVKLNNPGLIDLHRKGDVAYVELGNPGVPHAVKEMPGLEWEQAEELRNYYLQAKRSDIKLEKGAHFIVDLIGLEVYTEEGNLLGILKEVLQPRCK